MYTANVTRQNNTRIREKKKQTNDNFVCASSEGKNYDGSEIEKFETYTEYTSVALKQFGPTD